jgi:hypothetical protein
MISSMKVLSCLSYLASPILGLALDPSPVSANATKAAPYQAMITEVGSAFANENYGQWQLIE